MRVAGIMSGTSVDGVDAAVVDIDTDGVNLRAFEMFPYSKSLRNSIFQLFNPETSRVDDICHLNFALGEVFADSVIKLCQMNDIPLESIDLIGSHGQTIYHNPKGRLFKNKKIRSTLQIGEPSVITERTGITTVADFRPRDMAAGGHGAPLVPYADFVLFADRKKHRVIQNIGGIANLTYLPPACKVTDIIAFDTGPGNMIIDGIISRLTKGKKRYDPNGKMAAKGEPDEDLLLQLMEHSFIRRKPPKTTGREEFGDSLCEDLHAEVLSINISPEDLLATVTAFTATSIARSYKRFLPKMPDEVILCGGGANNSTLVNMLKAKLNNITVLKTDDFGINSDAKEAVSFAILAYAAINGLPNNVPSATGASKQVVTGKIIPA